MSDLLKGLGARIEPTPPEYPRAEKPEPEPERTASAPPVETHMSPVVHVDTLSGLAMLEFRDRETGEVTDQYPDPDRVKKQVAVYEHTGGDTATTVIAGAGDAEAQQPDAAAKPAQRPKAVAVVA